MTDLNTLIQAHWNADAALKAAKEAEKVARQQLADFLSKDSESGLANKTVTLSGGWKLRQEVQRTVRLDKSHDGYRELPSILGSDALNRLVKTKQTTEFSYSGYKSLTAEQKAAISAFTTEGENVTIKYDPPKENR